MKSRRLELNDALHRTERALIAERGLPGRDWYRHQLYAPGLNTGHEAKTLPVTSVLKALNARVEEAARLARGLGE